MPVPALAYVSLRAKTGAFKVHSSPQSQTGPLTIDYTYDPLNRLTAADYSTGDYYHYTYDSAGNRLTQSASVNSQTSAVNYAYDSANRLTSVNGVNYTFDANGNLLSDGTNTYTYGPANRLIGFNGPSTTSTYAYNGLDDRLRQTVNGQPINYALDINTGLPSVLADNNNTYTYGLDHLTQTSGAGTSYFLGDALGSTRQLTDASGEITLAQRYDPFGNGVTSTGNASSIFGYTGEQTDPTGLQYLRARYYDPGTGRFLSHDSFPGSLGLPQSQNPYAYGLNNPVLYTDPSGMSAEPWDSPVIQNWLNNSINQAIQLIPGLGNWQCIQWDQLLMRGGAAAIALMMNASVFWNTHLSYWRDYINGARDQWFDDVFLGLPTYLAGVDLANNDNPAYQAGRRLGRAIALTQAMIETTIGVLILAATIPTITITVGVGAACALATGGTCALPAGIVVTGEVAMAAVGAALAVHGGVMLLRAASEGGGGGSQINITQRALKHVKEGHTIGGTETAGNSIFNEDEDIISLIRKAESTAPEHQAGGNYQRIVDAGRTIGIDRSTELPTSIYTVITDASGNLVTAFPGTP